MDQNLMDPILAHHTLQQSIGQRRAAIHQERINTLDPKAPNAAIVRDQHEELVWPRLDLAATENSLIDAVNAGYTSTSLIQAYATAAAAVLRHQTKHAMLRLINSGVLIFGDDLGTDLGTVLPGPRFPSSPSL